MNRRQFHRLGFDSMAALAAVMVSTVAFPTQVAAGEVALTTPQALNQRIMAGAAPAILDVRSKEEFASGHIPGAINLPITELAGRVNELAAYKDTELVVHCETGPRAGMATWLLKRNGFSRLVALEGHMRAWRSAGLPMTR